MSSIVFFSLVLSWAGPLLFINMQYSLLSIAYEISYTRNIRNLSSLPFLSLLTNSVVWVIYGVYKNEMPVLLPNILGVLTGLFSIAYYQIYSVYPIPLSYFLTSLIIIGGAAGSGYLLHDIEMVGYIGSVLAVLMMASPLATLGRVMREKSTRCMPFYTSMSAWMNACSWSLYGGLIAHDNVIFVPNMISLGLACVQLSLYVIYGFDHRREDKKSMIMMKSRTVRALSFNNLDILLSDDLANENTPIMGGDGTISKTKSYNLYHDSVDNTNYKQITVTPYHMNL